MATDLLTTIRGEIEARLAELRPRVHEYEELLAADGALVAKQDGAPAARPRGASSKPRRASSEPGAKPPRAARSQRTAKAAQAAKPARTAKPAQAAKPARPAKPQPAKPPRAPRGAAEQAILAALEHGSHTAGELVMVTAMSAQNVRGNLIRLTQRRAIAKTKRDGRTAYVLASASG
jgi:hypothetical protein